MVGPMAYSVPGQRRRTACASTWLVEWRMTSRPSGLVACDDGDLLAVVESSAVRDRRRRRRRVWAATAAFASRGPIACAASRTVAPSASSRGDPSGRVTWRGMLHRSLLRARAPCGGC